MRRFASASFWQATMTWFVLASSVSSPTACGRSRENSGRWATGSSIGGCRRAGGVLLAQHGGRPTMPFASVPSEPRPCSTTPSSRGSRRRSRKANLVDRPRCGGGEFDGGDRTIGAHRVEIDFADLLERVAKEIEANRDVAGGRPPLPHRSRVDFARLLLASPRALLGGKTSRMSPRRAKSPARRSPRRALSGTSSRKLTVALSERTASMREAMSSTASIFRSEPMVSRSISLMRSISSPKKSTRTGRAPPGGKMSRMPPRTAKSPGSSMASAREYPASASQLVRWARETRSPARMVRARAGRWSGVGTPCMRAWMGARMTGCGVLGVGCGV